MNNIINELRQPLSFTVEKFIAPLVRILIFCPAIHVEPIAMALVPSLYESFAIDSNKPRCINHAIEIRLGMLSVFEVSSFSSGEVFVFF